MTVSQVLELRVLSSCARQPQHAKTLKPVKPIVERLVRQGLLRRFVRPPATVPLWLELTERGEARLAAMRSGQLSGGTSQSNEGPSHG